MIEIDSKKSDVASSDKIGKKLATSWFINKIVDLFLLILRF